jgi:uncharacterized protein (TIGR03435 family)
MIQFLPEPGARSFRNKNMRLAFLVMFGTSLVLAAPPAFDVASVKVLKVREAGRPDNIQTAPGSLTMRNIRLRACIHWAYGVDEFQVKGPDWLNSDRYEIIAKAAGPAPVDELKAMLQTLLAERFQLALHRETKTTAVYVLGLAKGGPKFHASDDDGEPVVKPKMSAGAMGITGQRIPLTQVTDILARILQAPVVDQTGLTGRYDMNIDVSAYISKDGATGEPKLGGGMSEMIDALFTGLQEQLGLKLEAKKIPMDLLIIDHLERVPSEN